MLSTQDCAELQRHRIGQGKGAEGMVWTRTRTTLPHSHLSPEKCLFFCSERLAEYLMRNISVHSTCCFSATGSIRFPLQENDEEKTVIPPANIQDPLLGILTNKQIIPWPTQCPDVILHKTHFKKKLLLPFSLFP